jgi:hypothetical protein
MSTSFCANCGRPLSAGAKFCAACGVPVLASETESTARMEVETPAIPPTNIGKTTSKGGGRRRGCGLLMLLIVGGAILIGAIVALSGGDDDGEPVQSRCLDVPANLGAGISEGLSSGITASGWQAVKSNDFEKIYMIAAQLRGEGLGDDTYAVWASNSLELGGGLVFSVDGYAPHFSDWGDADTTDAQISVNDDGVEEAIDCVR